MPRNKHSQRWNRAQFRSEMAEALGPEVLTASIGESTIQEFQDRMRDEAGAITASAAPDLTHHDALVQAARDQP